MVLLKKLTFFLILAVLVSSFLNKKTYAYDAQCVGSGVASYVDGVMGDPKIQAILGNPNRHAYFLSPTFNMTESNFFTLANAMASSSTWWSKLDGVSGNSYNTFWGTYENPQGHATIMDWVDSAYSNAPLAFSGKKLFLPETGWNDLVNKGNGWEPTREEARTRLKDQVSLIKTDPRIIGAAFFNGFGTGGPEWSGYDMTLHQTDFSEINEVCSGDCGNNGVNTAAFFSQGGTFYDNARNIGATFTVEIASNDIDSAMVGIQAALDKNLTPVVRIGVGLNAGGFEAPSAYANFIHGINFRLDLVPANSGKKVYFVVGPNEPNSECWATPQCDCGITSPPPGTNIRTKISGNVKTLKMVIDSNTGAQRTNLPVKNATVAAYTGRYNFGSGMMRGQIKNYQPFTQIPWQLAKTDEDGNFTVEADKYVEGNPTNPFENAVYLAFFCVNQGDPRSYAEYYGDPNLPGYVPMEIQGRRDPYLRDLYKVGLYEDVTNLNVVIDCDPEQPPNFVPLDDLNYVNRSSFLACSSGNYWDSNYESHWVNGSRGSVVAPDGFKTSIPLKQLDDTYKNTNTIPPAEEIPIVNLEGRSENSAVNSDILGPARIMAAGFGTIFPGEMFEPPREGGDPETLVSCDRIKECNQTLTPEGGSCNTYLSGGPAKSLSTPFYNKQVYESYSAAEAAERFVCNKDGVDYVLSQIQPPWDDLDYQGRYSLPKDYWSDEFLFGVPQRSTVGGADYYSADDSFSDDYAREERFVPNTQSVVALPFRSRNIYKYIPGANMQFSVSKAQDMIGTYKGDGIFDPPFDVLKSPLVASGGFDREKNTIDPQLDFDAEARKVGNTGGHAGTKYWRIGLQDSLCTTSFATGARTEPTNVTAFPRKSKDSLINESENFSTSYKFVTTETEKKDKSLLGTLFSQSLGTAYAAVLQDITEFFQGWWDAATGQGNIQPDTKYGYTGTCIDQITTTTGDPPTEVYSSKYTCEGDLQHPLAVQIDTSPSDRGLYQASELAGSYSLFLSLMSPTDAENLKGVGTLNTIDVVATNSKTPEDFAGFGLNAGFDNAWGGVSKDAPYYFQAAAGDPPVSSTYTAANWDYVDFGGIGVCDADGAAAPPLGHNVKEVESLIDSLDNSIYAGNYSQDNVRRCYNYIIKTAMNYTEDPAFVMATWVEESGASKDLATAGFGCVSGGVAYTLEAQLKCFVDLQYAYVNNLNHALCRNRPPTVGFLTVEKFMQIFSGGEEACKADNFGSNPYYESQMKELYSVSNIGNKALNENCILKGNTTRWDSTCH